MQSSSELLWLTCWSIGRSVGRMVFLSLKQEFQKFLRIYWLFCNNLEVKAPWAWSWLEVIICTNKKMIRNRMIRTLFCENNTHMGFYVFYILYISYLLFFIVNPCISIIQTLYYISYTFRLNTSECSSAFFTNYLAVLVNFLFIL